MSWKGEQALLLAKAVEEVRKKDNEDGKAEVDIKVIRKFHKKSVKAMLNASGSWSGDEEEEGHSKAEITARRPKGHWTPLGYHDLGLTEVKSKSDYLEKVEPVESLVVEPDDLKLKLFREEQLTFKLKHNLTLDPTSLQKDDLRFKVKAKRRITFPDAQPCTPPRSKTIRDDWTMDELGSRLAYLRSPDVKVHDSDLEEDSEEEEAETEPYFAPQKADENVDDHPDTVNGIPYTKPWDYHLLEGKRKALPAFEVKLELLDLIRKNQVVLITGETGSGKSTQIPQFILDDARRGHWKGRFSWSQPQIVVTQPRRISAVTLAERVAAELGEDEVGHSVGYQIRMDRRVPVKNKKGTITFVTVAMVLQWMRGDPTLEKVTHLILDEVHERDLHTDLVMVLIRRLLKRRPDLKVILMSATLNSEAFTGYFNDCPSFHIPGDMHPVEVRYLEDVVEVFKWKFGGHKEGKVDKFKKDKRLSKPDLTYLYNDYYSDETINSLNSPQSEELDPNLIVRLLKHLRRTQTAGEGAALVFLPGWSSITWIHGLLEADEVTYDEDRFEIHILHSLVPHRDQMAAFAPAPEGVFKVVLATNMAETSITIPDVVYVIDAGLANVDEYHADTNLDALTRKWISKANARQRKGRAGRVRPGICYRLYTRGREELLDDHPVPEMRRRRLEDVILLGKLLKVGDVDAMLAEAPHPPAQAVLHRSKQNLRLYGALDTIDELTPLGMHMCEMPLRPMVAKLALLGAIFGCLNPVLDIAAALEYKSPFIVKTKKDNEINARKVELDCEGQRSDHLLIKKVMAVWECLTMEQDEEEKAYFAADNYLEPRTLDSLIDLKWSFALTLYRKGFVDTPDPWDAHANRNSDSDNLILAALGAALYPNLAQVKVEVTDEDEFEEIKTLSGHQGLVHAGRSIACGRLNDGELLVYYQAYEQGKGVANLWDVSVLPTPKIFLFLGQVHGLEGQGHEEMRERFEMAFQERLLAENWEIGSESDLELEKVINFLKDESDNVPGLKVNL